MPKKTSHVKKMVIPKALREQVWIQNIGHKFENKCLIEWCQNKINVFDFHVGHNIPESKGGSTTITNLKPICARCNLSMGSQFSIEEWTQFGTVNKAPFTVGQPNKEILTVGQPNKAILTKTPWWLCC